MCQTSSRGRKYAVGKMAEIMVACNEMIFKIQEEVYHASCDAVDMGDVPALCTSSSTCLGQHPNTMPEKIPINRSTSLPTPPDPKSVQDLRLRQLYQKLMDLESVGRLEWLKVFMYMSNYMRVLRPLARSEWDEPKKFIQRQTLVLDGPYPGISNNLIASDNKQPRVSNFGKMVRKSLRGSVPERSLINVKNMELESLEDHHKDVLFKNRIVDCRKPERSDQGILCDCLEVVSHSLIGSKTRRKQLAEKFRPKYFEKQVYCVE